ncbi:MAG: PstS family phosphate ABC transporter substrate-binding protein [Richelia sp. RM2_1_2]|nr:PstS family phosphate ABC transporter substrate-binding protein [Richelia sp. SM2_1_7]NJM20038.1 PstS family phosphate ABC transporter substrate-binding protein [Richelia sp. SM1_7_0]NJN07851.1 PstS family phosphate ABC transporter substrate-binding protein [Richelia sp. RM1_1_1]NJO28968.1 PstS family phosphate ABC transporter substrate-binding protein [Richelia sp. SL_2_1]NJO62270.1 PstS family phosphate ABC transporter substrate-binding protein [Richelia sp. RM2_1_2]
MSQKNETAVLVLALTITLGLIGGVYWWFTRNYDITLGSISNNQSQPQPKSQPNLQSNQETFASVKEVPSGLFTYGGSTTWAPIRKDVDSEIIKAFPQFQLRYTNPTTGNPGSGTGIKMLLNNQLAFSQSSRSVKDQEYQQAEQRNFKLEEIPVAIDGIAITVHPDLNIPGLTLAQIKDIYTGKITNWQQVGGENLAIKPYSRRLSEGGTVEFFNENILGSEKFADNVEFTLDTTDGLRKVAQNKAGIYYASAPEVVGQCAIKPLPIGVTANKFVAPYQEPLIQPSNCPQQRNQLNAQAFKSGEYPITRRLFVIVKRNGQIDEQAGVVYAKLLLTEQGQELISQTGFVRIK